MTKVLLSLFALLTLASTSYSQEVMDLYNGPIPGEVQAEDLQTGSPSSSLANVSHPALTLYRPAPGKANGTAMIICPGGGYTKLVMGREGEQVARQMNNLGITAFVLKYRLPSDRIMKDKSVGPLQDAQRAIQLVREKAANWQVDPAKIGVIGFSAGGHLASSLGTHFDSAFIDNPKNTSLRPDFMVLVYPVISFQDSVTHMGSRTALLGAHPSAAAKDYFSNEKMVAENTPPTLLLQATDDQTVQVENSVLFYQALVRHQVSAAMHLFDIGGHGFSKEPAKSNWFRYVTDWLKYKGWIAQ